MTRSKKLPIVYDPLLDGQAWLDRAADYHENTKLNRANNPKLADRVAHVIGDNALFRLVCRSRKTYPSCDRIELPRVPLGDVTTKDAIVDRRSQTGEYGGGRVTLDQLAAILRYSYGPTAARPIADDPNDLHFLRATPSAGGLYPSEIYLAALGVDGLDEGLYHYAVLEHSLEVVRSGPIKDDILGCIIEHDFNDQIAVLFAITAVLPRTLAKYLFRGYRFLLYDVGALIQSLYLTSSALGLGTCAIGGFYDNELGELLRIDNVEEQVMALFTIGERGPGLLEGKDVVRID